MSCHHPELVYREPPAAWIALVHKLAQLSEFLHGLTKLLLQIHEYILVEFGETPCTEIAKSFLRTSGPGLLADVWKNKN